MPEPITYTPEEMAWFEGIVEQLSSEDEEVQAAGREAMGTFIRGDPNGRMKIDMMFKAKYGLHEEPE